jgi:hypothetical protein
MGARLFLFRLRSTTQARRFDPAQQPKPGASTPLSDRAWVVERSRNKKPLLNHSSKGL